MEPSMEYLKVPAKYVSKYYAAPSFTGKVNPSARGVAGGGSQGAVGCTTLE